MKPGLLFFILVISKSCFSQTNIYHPFPDSNAVWNMNNGGCCYASCPPPLNDPYIIDYVFSRFLSGDTIINSLTFAKMYESGSSHEHCAISSTVNNWIFFNNNYVGCIRQDTALRQVYMLHPGSGAECVLYDFNMNVGDTVPIDCFASNDCVVVSSIDSILIGGSYRRQFNLSGQTIYPYTIIEGIGSTAGHFEPYCAIEFSGHLTCFSQNGQVLYPDSTTSCNNYTSSGSVNDDVQIAISPNPFHDQAIVQISKHSVFENLELFDVMGRKVRQIKISGQVISIERGNLKPGIYFLMLTGNKHNCRIEKIIVE